MRKHGHIYTGFVIMTIGILLMLGNMGIISWSILGGFSRIWPLILVAVGLNMFFNNHVAIKMLTFAGLITALIIAGLAYPKSDDWNIRFDMDRLADGTYSHKDVVRKEYPMEQGITSAELNLKIPAGAIALSGSEDMLLNARYPGADVKETVETMDGGSRKVFNISGDRLTIGSNTSGNKWDYSYELSNDIPWDVSIETGATDADLDFRDTVLKNLELNSGAGDIEIKIGKVDRKAIIAVDVKASDFKISIPEDVGYKAVIRGAIKDVTINGHDYVKDGDVYTSVNYNTAAQKVDMNLDVAVGDITIDRE